MDGSERADLLSPFHSLPHEIMVKILKNISTFDLLRFCDAFPEFKYVFGDVQLTRTVNLSRDTGFRYIACYPFLKTMNRLKSNYIRIFNITNVYWVPAEDIKKCLKALINVEEIHMLGTQVSLTPTNYESFQVTKLKKLAVPVENFDLGFLFVELNSLGFPKLESLCMQMTSKNGIRFQYFDYFPVDFIFISKLPNLEELWIYDYTDLDRICFDEENFPSENLKVFAYKGNGTFCPSSLKTDLTKIYSNYNLIVTEVYYEKACVKDIKSDPYCPRWINLFGFSTPYGLYDAKKIHEKSDNINKIFFKELNLNNSKECTVAYSLAIRRLLLSENVSRLKKIALKSCMFESVESRNPIRNRFNNPNRLSDERRFILDNLRKLEELEIDHCSRCSKFGIYNQIKHFRFLKKLTLVGPFRINGDVIKDVMENCDLLESLKVNVIGSNESFNQDFQRYISMAKNLKELRYAHCRVSLENIFHGLAEMKGSKIEKLFINCQSVEDYGMINLRKFFERNPNLEFALIVISTATDDMLEELSKEMGKYKNSPEKHFLAEKEVGPTTDSFPNCFKFELVSPESHVATLNMYQDFYCS